MSGPALAGSRPRRCPGRPPCGARGDPGFGSVALCAGLGASVGSRGQGGGGWPAAGRPWPARAGRRLAELGCKEAESTLAWPQVALRALKFRGRRERGQHPEEAVGSPVHRLGRLPDFGNWGVNLEHLRKLLPCGSPQSCGGVASSEWANLVLCLNFPTASTDLSAR